MHCITPVRRHGYVVDDFVRDSDEDSDEDIDVRSGWGCVGVVILQYGTVPVLYVPCAYSRLRTNNQLSTENGERAYRPAYVQYIKY